MLRLFTPYWTSRKPLHSFNFLQNSLRRMSSQQQQSNSQQEKGKITAAAAEVYSTTNEPDLYSLPVTIDQPNGAGGSQQAITINAVYQDTNPTNGSAAAGCPRGTVVSLHGAPGSHKDFKFITPLLTQRGIRMIGINWPGMGYSGYDYRLRNNNEERTQFVQAIIDHLQLKAPLVFLGHSRGCENAFRLACQNQEKTVGVVAANFVGLHYHKGVQPFWGVKLLTAIWEYSYWLGLQPLFAPFFKKLYDVIGLKAANGYIVGSCLKTMRTTDFFAQLPFVQKLQSSPDIRLLFAYSGKDFLVETERSRDLLNTIDNCQELTTETVGDDEQIMADTIQLIRGRQKHISVYFPNEGHFLQKFRCKFLAESIAEIFEQVQQAKTNAGK